MLLVLIMPDEAQQVKAAINRAICFTTQKQQI
jgi:hypothetical protein